MAVITLTTDFGTRDWFVGTMKGVILRLNPHAVLVDLTHDIPAGNIRGAAFALAAACKFFPKRTVHLAVVDPGVGSARQAIAVQTADCFFVGPDNGVLSLALAGQKIVAIRRLENEKFFLKPLSRTFHGRDIFAPMAAHLSRGVSIKKLGPPLKTFERLAWPVARRRGNQIEGEVVYIDQFGNAITNIATKVCADALGYPTVQVLCEVLGRTRRACPVRDFYQAVPVKKPVAVFGSSGFLEIAVNGGSAQKTLGLKIGTPVVARKLLRARSGRSGPRPAH
jgi:S-adenosylmethionine hydrolase